MESKNKRIAWNKGLKTNPLSQGTRNKLSLALRGKNTWSKGVKRGAMSEEHKRKIRESNIGKHYGKPSWNRGKTGLQVAWNKGTRIREQGSYPQKGSGNNKRLISHINWCISNQMHRVPDGCLIHHIDGNQFNNEPSNLQLMTKEFHSKLHREYEKLIC